MSDYKEKIFTHKFLDPECVETGCQSLVLKQKLSDERKETQNDFTCFRLSDVLRVNEIRLLKDEILGLKEAIVQVFDPDGCGCIKDLPGDNYTCTAHQKLWSVRREALPAVQEKWRKDREERRAK